jgi:glutamate-1-semialdehyde 2,1-aminomutase
MANGFAVAALTGKREIMELGNILTPGHERVFLTSTTHGAEMSSLGAFIKTIEILERDQVIPYLWEYGRKLLSGMTEIATEFGIQDYLKIEGYSCSPVFNFLNKEGNPDLGLKTLFGQEMIKKNVMLMHIVTSFAHQKKELELTLEGIRSVMPVMVQALENGYEKYLEGNVVKPVFRKFN